jgi:hypothetical protein
MSLRIPGVLIELAVGVGVAGLILAVLVPSVVGAGRLRWWIVWPIVGACIGLVMLRAGGTLGRLLRRDD